MTDTQLYLAIGIPMLFNATLMSILIWGIGNKFDAFRAEIKVELAEMETRLNLKITQMEARLNERIDTRLVHR